MNGYERGFSHQRDPNRDREGAAKGSAKMIFSFRIFALLILLATAAALALRLFELDLRPMHGDEAVHTYRFNNLWETGEYVYDPHEYHGPTLYYLTLPVALFTGAKDYGDMTEGVFRIVPALLGASTVLLVLLLADGLGRPATACAVWLTALSPAMVYYSRYYIQETLLVLFTFGLIVAGWRYIRSRRMPWALLAGAFAGLMHATKETCVIAFAAIAAALLGTIVWSRRAAETTEDSCGTGLASRFAGPADRATDRKVGPAPVDERTKIRNSKMIFALPFVPPWRTLVGAVLVAVAVSVLSYSVLFTNSSGPLDSLRAFGGQIARAGGNGLHAHPWYYYLKMLMFTRCGSGPIWSEALILVLGGVGMIAVFATAEPVSNRLKTAPTDVGKTCFARFLALYTLLMTLAYSAIPYKTPWCMLEFLHPMIMLAGVGAVVLIRRVSSKPAGVVLCALLLAGMTHLGAQAYAGSFKYPADNRNPYAYAHPVNDVKRLATWIERLAVVHPDGRRMVVKVIAENYWPLPWYLRRFERVGYWETPPNEPAAPVIIVSSDAQPALDAQLVNEYRIDHYGLLPGEVLFVYAEQQLWEAFVEQQERNAEGVFAPPGVEREAAP